MKVGEKIKNLRLAQELTQEDLANRADLTKGFISLLERDLTSPSLETLELMLNALDTSLAEFFADNDEDYVVFSRRKRVVVEDEEGITKEILIAGAQDREMDIMLITLKSGASTKREGTHYGDESGLVLSGTVWVNVGKESFKAAKGDAFYYTANKQHWLENRSKRVAKILWISAPPSF